MPRTKAISTVAVPLWMVIVTIVLFLARMAALYYDSRPGSENVSAIAWLGSHQPGPNSDGKLILYQFSASWCGPCRIMESTTFQDRKVVEEIKNHFIAVRIMDPQSGDQSPAALKIKKLQEKYKVTVFPTLVVCLPDGTSLNSNFGFFSGRSLVKFLEKSRRSTGYVQGKLHFAGAHYDQAASDFTAWLKQADWHDRQTIYGVVFGVISDRMMHQEKAAQALLELAQAKTDPSTQSQWPYALVQYLAGHLSPEELVKKADGDLEGEAATDARAFMGMNLLTQGKRGQALKAWRWVQSDGNRYAYTYDWTLAELKRQEKWAGDGQAE